MVSGNPVEIAQKIMLNLPKKIYRKIIEPIFEKFIDKKLALELKEVTVDKIHIGCGDDYVPGWLNIDLFPAKDIPYGSIVKEGALVLRFNMTKNLPVSDNTIKYIYASHFIEHLTFEEGLIFLKRCYKMMQSGGVIRLAFPDLELFIKKYYENDTEFFNKWQDANKIPIKSKGELLLLLAHGFGHKCVYDAEMIKLNMEQVGFINITRKKHHDSLLPDIQKIEPSTQSRILTSAFVGAQKY